MDIITFSVPANLKRQDKLLALLWILVFNQIEIESSVENGLAVMFLMHVSHPLLLEEETKGGALSIYEIAVVVNSLFPQELTNEEEWNSLYMGQKFDDSDILQRAQTISSNINQSCRIKILG